MPRVNLERTKRLAVRTAKSLQAQVFVRLLRGREDEIKQLQALDPKSVRVFIDRDADLADRLSPEFFRGDLVRRIAGVSTDVLVEVLYEYHPGLAAVLDTEEGRAWWGRQRRDVLGRR